MDPCRLELPLRSDVSWMLNSEHNGLTVVLIGLKPKWISLCLPLEPEWCVCVFFLTLDMSSVVQKATSLKVKPARPITRTVVVK